ncbi:MAG TPA: cytochrome P450 [Acidimicrobiales bacterium]|jgi:cytochrome P450
MSVDTPAASDEVAPEEDVSLWGDNVQADWEKMRTGPAVLDFGTVSMMTSPTAIDEFMHNPELVSSNPEAQYLGSETGLIPLQVDPPEHRRYRRMLDPLFTPPKMAKLEGEVAVLVNQCIDQFIERGRCDLAAEFALPIPSGTFLHLLGLPLDRLDEFLAVKDDLIRPPGEGGAEADSARTKAAEWVFELFGEALDRRVAEPTDDILGHLSRLELAGELTREQTLNISLLQLMAGLDTVTASLECFFAFLARSPEHQRQLVEDPALQPKAVEELLRWMCPVPTVIRVTTADTEIEGCPVSSGTRMAVLLATTNIDPDRFERPTEVDFTRQSIKHLSFGVGIHRCLGSHLARMELRVALAEWHRRIPSYRLPEGFVPKYSPSIREITHLPVEFEPGVREG